MSMTSSTTAVKITPAQLRKIWASARDKGIDSDLLHTIVYQESKKEHISDLSLGEAKRVIDRLCGRRKQQKYKPNGRVAKMSYAQKSYIEGLLKLIKQKGLGYTFESIADKASHKPVEALTRADASKVITACKDILNRG